MNTREEVMAKIRQSIAKKKAWLDRSDVELGRIFAKIFLFVIKSLHLQYVPKGAQMQFPYSSFQHCRSHSL